MERKQDITRSDLTQALFDKLPYVNFYQFCTLLEQQQPIGSALLGSTDTPATDPIRFRSASEVGFPAAEFKKVEQYPNAPPLIETTFLGLYGVDSVLPSAFLDGIIQEQEGHESLMAFLDIFNHRIMTQYYRIWRKYSYPAGFLYGGADAISKNLLGLAGFAIEGSGEQISTPSTRLLALLGLITQKTRTAEGLKGIVALLFPNSKVLVEEFYPRSITLEERCALNKKNSPHLKRNNLIIGRRFKENNSMVNLIIAPKDDKQIRSILPGTELYQDLIALLRAYLGYRFEVKITMKLKRKQLLPPLLKRDLSLQLGYTTAFTCKNTQEQESFTQVTLGYYSGL